MRGTAFRDGDSEAGAGGAAGAVAGAGLDAVGAGVGGAAGSGAGGAAGDSVVAASGTCGGVSGSTGRGASGSFAETRVRGGIHDWYQTSARPTPAASTTMIAKASDEDRVGARRRATARARRSSWTDRHSRGRRLRRKPGRLERLAALMAESHTARIVAIAVATSHHGLGHLP